MNRATQSTRSPRTGQTTADERAKLLAAFDRSGLSAAAFARKHQINYTTFCGWRQLRDRAACSPEFVQVELPAISGSASLVVEVGAEIRLRISAPAHLELAAELLRRLRREGRC